MNEEMLYGLDICAGSGIGSWAFEQLGLCRTVCYVEHDAYCQRLLQHRMQCGKFTTRVAAPTGPVLATVGRMTG